MNEQGEIIKMKNTIIIITIVYIAFLGSMFVKGNLKEREEAALIEKGNFETLLFDEQEFRMPTYSGLIKITDGMIAAKKFSETKEDNLNTMIGFYVLESDRALAASTEIQSFNRFCFIKTVNDDGDALFYKVKESGIKYQNELAKKQAMYNTEDMRSVMGIDMKILHLKVHSEGSGVMGWSFYSHSRGENVLTPEQANRVSTATLINANEKVLTLTCSGTGEDLEWTRTISNDWARLIFKLNRTHVPVEWTKEVFIGWFIIRVL